jgi:hypothetical protein
MTDKTVEELITDIQTEVYQAAGPAVQIYSQEILVKKISDAFILFFDDTQTKWKRFLEYASYTLDGTTGKATGDVSATFAQFDHIYRVYPSNSDRPLSSWNTDRNPVLITGSQPIFVKPTATAQKIFQILPVTATGDVVVVGKQLPSAYPFDDLADVVPFDHLAIKYFVAWQVFDDDGANPSAAERLLKLYTNRMKQLEAENGQAPIAYNGGAGQVPTQWFDSDA